MQCNSARYAASGGPYRCAEIYCQQCVYDNRKMGEKSYNNNYVFDNYTFCFSNHLKRLEINPSLITEYKAICFEEYVQVFLTEEEECKHVRDIRLAPSPPPAPVTNPPPAPPSGPKKPTTKKGNENRKSGRVQNKARLAAARALKAKKAKMDKLVEDKRKRIADQQPKSIRKQNTEKISKKLVTKIQLTSSKDSSSSYVESSNDTSSDDESVTDVTSEDIVKGTECTSRSAKQNVSLCVNCEIVFIAPYY